MARPKIYGERVTTAVRLPEGVHRRLRAAAHERDVSANLLVINAITEYLERLPPIDEALGSPAPVRTTPSAPSVPSSTAASRRSASRR